jgi:hypothetical protein
MQAASRVALLIASSHLQLQDPQKTDPKLLSAYKIYKAMS